MVKNILLFITAFFGLAILLVACDPEPTEEPPAIPPSITLKPPFISQTPQFTATLTPSQTFTPSDTPNATATETPVTATATPTYTPTVALNGIIESVSNVNVREGPGNTFSPMATVAPNTDVGVIGSERNDRNQIWYFIEFEGVDGVVYRGYVASTLIDVFGQVIPTLGPTPEPGTSVPAQDSTADDDTATEASSPEPFATATLDGSVTPIPTDVALQDVSDVNILAYCREDRVVPRNPTEDQTVSIYWRWWVTRPELMQDHLDHVEYEVLLDGQRLEDWEDYRTDMVRDASNRNYYTIWWYVPVGKLAPGEHNVEYKVTWDEEVFDGIQNYGPGTNEIEETGSCTFTVTEVGE